MKLYKLSKIIVSILLLFNGTAFGGVDLNGDLDTIDCGNAVSVTTAFAISFWLKHDTLKDYSGLLTKGTDGQENYEFTTFANGLIHCPLYWTDTSRTIINSAAGVAVTGTWQHYVMNYNGTTRKLYVNNVEKATETINKTAKTNAVSLFIGNESGEARYLDGQVSEVAVWEGTGLSLTEISLLFNSKVKGMPYQIQPANLILYLPLDDFSDGTALDTNANGYKDRSGTGNHGQGVDADTDSLNIAEELLSYPE